MTSAPQAIKAAYNLPRGCKPREAINHAIQEEIPGGAECLDALRQAHETLHRLNARHRDNAPSIQDKRQLMQVTLDMLIDIRDAMAEAIITRYNQPSEDSR